MSNGEAVRTFLPVHITTLLERMVEGRKILTVGEGETICSQAGDSNAIYFIAAGQVKITVVAASGKEVVLALLGSQQFFAEVCMIGQSSRVKMATALEPSTLLRIERRAMLHAIQDHPELRERLLNALLIRNMAINEDLCDQLFNQNEKRLARALLKLARSKDQDIYRDAQIPALSHETLAEMIGATRSCINRFMIKFRKMGLIDYGGRGQNNPRLIVRTGLLSDKILQNAVNRREMGSAA